MSSHFSPHSNETKVTDSALVWAQLRSAHHPMRKEKKKSIKQKEVSILVMLLSHFTGRT
jgi:hypothetical protein